MEVLNTISRSHQVPAARSHRVPAAALFLICLCVSLAGLIGCQKNPAASEAPVAAESKPPTGDGEESAEGVSLKPEEVESMGIVVTAALPTNHAPETAGFGMVSPHEVIAQAVAELVTAAATERQSRAVLARTQHLAGTPGAMPADALESAERQGTVDQAALLLARQRLTASFGQNPPWKDDAGSPVLRALAGGEAKLVRVTFALGALSDATPATLRLSHIDATKPGKSWISTTIWNAPADATVPGRSFFALLKGSNVGEGERLLAWAPVGAPEPGVLVPASAAVISDSKFWCYVERKPGVFVRTELDTSAPLAEGYFVKDGIAAGDKVVTASAGLLLARETNPSTAAD
jgi:hypothetical protein